MTVRYICRVCGATKSKYRTNTRRSYKEWNYVDDNGHRVGGKRCFECALAAQRVRRKKQGDHATKRYEKTTAGFLMRLYRNMKSRVTGVQKAKFHLYEGKELLAKQGFYEWAESCPEFLTLYAAYEASGFDRKLAPSVDRIDSSKGYILGNMEWVTMAENSRRGVESKRRQGIKAKRWKITDAQAIEIRRRRLAGEGSAALAREFGLSQMHVYTLSRSIPKAG